MLFVSYKQRDTKMIKNNKDRIVYLITQKVLSISSIEEEKELQAWLDESEENLVLFNKIADLQSINNSKECLDSLDVDSAHRLLLETGSTKSKIWKTFSLAASIIILIGVGSVFYYLSESSNDNFNNGSLATKRIDTRKSTLTFADGETVSLNDSGIKEHINKRKNISKTRDTLKYSSKDDQSGEEKINYNKLFIARGGEYKIQLEDGSFVWLNSETTFKFPEGFGKDKRVVYLEGEAYFNVKHDSKRPFIVVTKNSGTKVLGTSFNISSYKNEEEKITLVTGRVELTSNKTKEKKQLTPGKQAIILNNRFDIKDVDVEEYIAWTKGRIIFNSTPLDEVMTKLCRWYDLEVFFTNEDIKDITFTGNLGKYDDIKVFLDLIKESSDVNYRIKNNNIVLMRK